jgi:hypothetical protein
MIRLFAALLLSLAAFSATHAHAAPRSGTIQFGRHMDFQSLDVYPAHDRFPGRKAPLYAARFSHATRSTYVTVALSAVFGAAVELKALERDYVDEGTDELMGWLPKPSLRPGLYILTIRAHGRTLASGSFRVVRNK